VVDSNRLREARAIEIIKGTFEYVQAAEKRMNEVKAALLVALLAQPPDHELCRQLLQELRIATDEYAKQVATFAPQPIDREAIVVGGGWIFPSKWLSSPPS
jgi:hypothetical protein